MWTLVFRFKTTTMYGSRSRPYYGHIVSASTILCWCKRPVPAAPFPTKKLSTLNEVFSTALVRDRERVRTVTMQQLVVSPALAGAATLLVNTLVLLLKLLG